MILIKIRGRFNGLYKTGQGWLDGDVLKRWNEFWNGLFIDRRYGNEITDEPIHWGVVRTRPGGVPCLAMTSGGASVYMHPSGFSTVVATTLAVSTVTWAGEGAERRSYRTFLAEPVGELIRICRACAEACGAEFSFESSAEVSDVNGVIDVRALERLVPVEDTRDYQAKCGEVRPA